MSARDWAELLRVSAVFTVPGDALAGASAAGLRPNGGTLLGLGCSLCLYEAGMALNDWADRAEDAVERPERPLPSGRIAPSAALAAAGALTAAGLGLAAVAGRPALATATALAGAVWAYDLGLKHTPAGPVAMAAARGLDLLLGATASAGRGADPGTGVRYSGAGRTASAGSAAPQVAAALPAAALLGVHTLAVTTVSRRETQGGSVVAPLAALATTAAIGRYVWGRGTVRRAAAGRLTRTEPAGSEPGTPSNASVTPTDVARGALAAGYAVTAARPFFHAALNPSPELTQRAVGGGIRAMIPLQAAFAARAGRPGAALLTAALAPLARTLARKVSVT
ncbi:prenyltransferase [Streptomyces sp. YIM 130001]|uniref:SCO3242 family prenyltransferase n=1 Tax=Streptomyces sp. YIM 130001 TaxID=2259644 RepID=UPI000E653C8F|nr:UbiA family prenyltransferase [Streptomyces sp. YIM 130001]RII12342.1 prenyltransferase [Streptomyces sp. YIM 130001]